MHHSYKLAINCYSVLWSQISFMSIAYTSSYDLWKIPQWLFFHHPLITCHAPYQITAILCSCLLCGVVANCLCNENHWLGIVNFSYCGLLLHCLSCYLCPQLPTLRLLTDLKLPCYLNFLLMLYFLSSLCQQNKNARISWQIC